MLDLGYPKSFPVFLRALLGQQVPQHDVGYIGCMIPYKIPWVSCVLDSIVFGSENSVCVGPVT
jgi:hypothetical protein